jgi:flagellar motor protein MotB
VSGRGFGRSQPIANHGQETTRQRNRRVEVVVVGLKGANN